MNGAVILEDSPVHDINLNSAGTVESVSLANNDKIYTKTVVLATGAWSKDIAKKLNVSLPTRVTEHSYVVSDVIPGIRTYPNVRHYDHSIYFKVGETERNIVTGRARKHCQ